MRVSDLSCHSVSGHSVHRCRHSGNLKNYPETILDLKWDSGFRLHGPGMTTEEMDTGLLRRGPE
jgi:hypothetical protein